RQLTHPLSVLQNNTSLALILKILRNRTVQMNRNLQIIPRIIKNNFMQLPTMPMHRRRIRRIRSARLMVHDLARVVLVDAETVVLEVDAQRLEAADNLTLAPAVEDAAGVGAEGDDVAEDLELREVFVDFDVVALALAFDGCGETAEAGADDDDFDA